MWMTKPLSFMQNLAARHGDLFTVRISGRVLVLTSSPEHIRQILTGDPRVFHAGEGNAVVAPLVGRNSLLLLDEDRHLRERRRVLPPLHGDRMRRYAEIMAEITEASLDAWPQSGGFALHPLMQGITLQVIMRTVFGIDEGASMTRTERELNGLLRGTMNMRTMVLSLMGINYLESMPWTKTAQHKGAVDRALYAQIAERRQRGDEGRGDILSVLAGAAEDPLSDEELHDELMTMLVAGHETTATALAWTFREILSAPLVEERIRAELNEVAGAGPLTPEHLPELKYLDAVIKESLRLRPIIPIIARYLTEPVELGGYHIPAGVRIAPCIYLLHMRPDLYPEPSFFRPERFLNVRPDPYQWLPFGGGVRRCAGMAFALYEMKIVLAAILRRARFSLATPGPVRTRRRSVTLVPADGTRVILRERMPRGQHLHA